MGSQIKLFLVDKPSRADYEKAFILKILQESKKNDLPIIFRNDIVERFVQMGLPKPYDSSLKWAEKHSGIVLKKSKVKGIIKYYLKHKDKLDA